MTRTPLQSWGALVMLAVLSAVIAGCQNPDDPHATIIRQADSLYVFASDRPALSASDTGFQGPVVDDGGIPKMSIATATLKPNTPQPADRIIARIESQSAYAPMGIQKGYNYVVRNSWSDADSSTWVTRIVPRNSVSEHGLTRDSRRHEYTHGMNPKEPRLVILQVHSIGLGLCLEDPMCPTGHCGYY